MMMIVEVTVATGATIRAIGVLIAILDRKEFL